MATLTSRTLVRQGVAAYFGGSWNPEIRAYQNGPLLSAGLSTVRYHQGKKLVLSDFVAMLPPGRGMGAYAIVRIPHDREYRRGWAGAPQLTGGAITAGGVKMDIYRVQLRVFHLAQVPYIEDAGADLDALIEAIKQQIRVDRTLGGICTDAGETSFGIQVDESEGVLWNNNALCTAFEITFEIRTQFIA